jgi:hypothetical protein
VQPFLPPEENARRPNPYDRIGAARELDGFAHALRERRAPPDRVATALEAMVLVDPGNPELHFWLGEARGLAGDTARAREAFLEAWRLGRRDADTLVRLVGVHAKDREREALAELERLGAELPAWDCRMWLLEARLHVALKELDEAREACRKAEEACRGARDRAALDAVRKEGTCE